MTAAGGVCGATGRVEGVVYSRGSSSGVQAALLAIGGELFLELSGQPLRSLAGEALEISDAISGVPRRIGLSDGSVFVTAQTPALSALFGMARTVPDRGRVLVALERPGRLKFAVLIVVFFALLAGLRWSLPVISDALCVLVPSPVERQMGRLAFGQLDEARYIRLLEPTTLPEDTRARLQTRFRELVARAGLPPDTVLEFRSSPKFGPNAFAFPGGPVVMTDELVEFALKQDPEHGFDGLAGILAHEITHITERHGLKRLVRIGGISMTLAVLIGDMGSLMDQVAVLGSLALDMGYSRDFEREADRGAVLLLQASGQDVEPLRRLMARLGEEYGVDPGWLSSHPGFDERDAILRGDFPAASRLSFE